ncbi:MAG: hypothetical protein LCH52_13535 [Bacteroidetes bacterium]|nr:hypothetical protein [Bacteroidota bacterium]
MRNTFLIIILSPFLIFSQDKPDLDSVFNVFTDLRTTQQVSLPLSAKNHKCGLPSLSPLVFYQNELNPEQKSLFKDITARPVLDTSIVSPKKLFRIHYDKSGFQKPAYSVDSLALALDSAYQFEVTFLKYPAPPSDDTAGGDSLYDVYIVAFQYYYGETIPETKVSPFLEQYSSYIKIDNDFAGFYTTGLPAAKVTAAHEFHHAIQMGNYILRYSDIFFHELVSTSMEEFVFPEVNDYLAYLPDYFENPGLSVSKYSGYDLAPFSLMMKERLGYDIIKRQWELMIRDRAVKAIANSLIEAGSSATEEFNCFGRWNYFTGYRAIPGKYYTDAARFPVIVNYMKSEIAGNRVNISLKAHPVSNNSLMVVNSQNGSRDTIVTIVTDYSTEKWFDSPDSYLDYSYSLYTYQAEGSALLFGSFYDKFGKNPAFQAKTATIINNVVIERGDQPQNAENDPYPSPFTYGKNREDVIYFPFKFLQNTTTLLNVYNVAGDLIYSGEEPSWGVLRNLVKWQVRNNFGQKLSSGVYIYILKANDQNKSGKLVILN